MTERAALESLLDDAERKAWDALSAHRYLQFGQWAATWVLLNRTGGFGRKSPWSGLVSLARAQVSSSARLRSIADRAMEGSHDAA